MDYLKSLFGMQGGKRKTRRSTKKRGGANCETGEACAAAFSADSSLSQGETFAKNTALLHGGKRQRKHQRGGAADLTQAFEPMPAELHQQAGTAVLDQAIADLSKFAPQTGGSRRNQRGGSAALADAFSMPEAGLHEKAGTSVLDAAIDQLKQFLPNHNGGARKSRRTKHTLRNGGALGSSPVDAPDMLLHPEDYQAAYLSPQWEQENLVNTNFHAPPAPAIGGRRRNRKSYRNRKAHRKASRKSRSNRKGSRKSRSNRKASRKH